MWVLGRLAHQAGTIYWLSGGDDYVTATNEAYLLPASHVGAPSLSDGRNWVLTRTSCGTSAIRLDAASR